jgi:hypothetical protein
VAVVPAMLLTLLLFLNRIVPFIPLALIQLRPGWTSEKMDKRESRLSSAFQRQAAAFIWCMCALISALFLSHAMTHVLIFSLLYLLFSIACFISLSLSKMITLSKLSQSLLLSLLQSHTRAHTKLQPPLHLCACAGPYSLISNV